MTTKRQRIGAFEAKNRFSDLLERVGRGAEIIITKHDKPVARLVPAESPGLKERQQATADLRKLRTRYSLAGLSARELIAAGRR